MADEEEDALLTEVTMVVSLDGEALDFLLVGIHMVWSNSVALQSLAPIGFCRGVTMKL